LDWALPQIILPLAISFFTFQQIAYLCDAHAGAAVEHNLLDYCLFITFFPHLIAGPITHHSEMLPQFGRLMSGKGEVGRVAVGFTLFLIGLFKKVIIADPFGSYARPVFAAASHGQVPDLAVAWTGALSYALQIYFDFSGYTDMAIGLGLLFGISLPPNFDSPFKARNIVDYWARWHMTLTRFITAYIYNPIAMAMMQARMERGLPMPKRGRITPGAFVMLVALPVIVTMFISGVWHGAGWQFVIFGVLHGVYITVFHAWRAFKTARGMPGNSSDPVINAGSVLLTLVCVLVGLVFFRAPDVPSAVNLLHGMVGGRVIIDEALLRWPLVGQLAAMLHIPVGETQMIRLVECVWIAIGFAVVWTMPNATQWMRHYRTALDAHSPASWIERWVPASTWRPSPVFGCIIGLVGMLTLMRTLSAAPTEFLYFQF
jgi:alginate O-acetyltransferase complex protein AlgI